MRRPAQRPFFATFQSSEGDVKSRRIEDEKAQSVEKVLKGRIKPSSALITDKAWALGVVAKAVGANWICLNHSAGIRSAGKGKKLNIQRTNALHRKFKEAFVQARGWLSSNAEKMLCIMQSAMQFENVEPGSKDWLIYALGIE